MLDCLYVSRSWVGEGARVGAGQDVELQEVGGSPREEDRRELADRGSSGSRPGPIGSLFGAWRRSSPDERAIEGNC